MTKNYSTKKNFTETKLPSENTIQFLLNYSKSLHFIDIKDKSKKVEMNLN